jgi:uncharacterized membrane protein YidH (DUF202 family)
MLLPTLLVTFGTLGVALGQLGLALAQMLLADGSEEDAVATRQNARLVIVAGVAMLVVGGARILWA